MSTLSIEATLRVDELRQLVQEGLQRLSPKADVSVYEERTGPATRLALDVRSTLPGEAAEVRTEVAHALAQHICANLEPEFLMNLIRRHYSYFDAEERQQILNFARQEPQQESLRTLVLRRLVEYLQAHTVLNVDGFVTFRLKDYLEDLERNVDAAVDEFLLEREYREFIRLLRYFVEVQQPKIPLVHVQIVDNGQFELRDERLEPLQGEFATDFRFESQEGEISLDDLLVSSLITLAPARVEVHGTAKARELASVRTVRQVFGGRMRQCEGCSLCSAVLLGP